METDRLRYFCAIVEAGSLTRASEVLGISHSGLSKAISVLQDELGFKIFAPKGRGLELTERGKTLYEQSRKVLEMVNSIKGQVITPERSLRIGLPEVLGLVVSEPIARELEGSLTIEDSDTGEVEEKVLEKKSDFGFTFVPFPHKDLDHLKITPVTLSSFCRTGFFQTEDPDKIPYVIPSVEIKDNPLSLRIRDGWNFNLPRFTPYRANSLSIALRMVQSGSCAIYTPSFFVRHLNQFETKARQLVELNLTPKRRKQEQTSRDIFLVKRNNEDESKAMKTVVKIIRQACRA
jgi:DNA-binding transcriptional LysR family regulator